MVLGQSTVRLLLLRVMILLERLASLPACLLVLRRDDCWLVELCPPRLLERVADLFCRYPTIVRQLIMYSLTQIAVDGQLLCPGHLPQLDGIVHDDMGLDDGRDFLMHVWMGRFQSGSLRSCWKGHDCVRVDRISGQITPVTRPQLPRHTHKLVSARSSTNGFCPELNEAQFLPGAQKFRAPGSFCPELKS